MDNDFPKCLYQGNVLYSEYKIVANEEEQAEANKAGFGVDADVKTPAVTGKKAK